MAAASPLMQLQSGELRRAASPISSIGTGTGTSISGGVGVGGEGDSQTGGRRKIKKRVERVAHEVAPRLSTIVAGQEGLLAKRRAESAVRKQRKTNGLKSSTLALNNRKRYSSFTSQGLVADESGELHDPEYEGIKIVQHRGRDGSSSGRDSDSEVGTSSSEEDEEATNYDHRPSRSYHHRAVGATSHNQHTTIRDINSRYTNGLGGGLSSSSQHLNAYSSTINNRSRLSNMSTRSSEYSGDSVTGGGSRSKSLRNYGGGGVTYLAPSVTMPPTSAYGNVEPYNPFTYVPTTTTAANAYSHSLLAPRSKYAKPKSTNLYPHPPPAAPSSSYRSTHLHVPGDTSMSTRSTSRLSNTSPLAAAYEQHPPQDEIAPPIAWNSTFTPSSEHPERHRTRQHTTTQQANETLSAVGSNVKRSIQSIKLDVSFGLMRLGKKK